MYKYSIWLLLVAAAGQAAQVREAATVRQRASLWFGGAGDSASFYLHKFAQNIGKETYYRSVSDSGVSYQIKFKFVDRGMAVPLDARLLVTPEDEPLSFWV